MGALFGKISVETPAHTVIHATESYQVWRYDASVAATVRASALAEDGVVPTGDDFQSKAFRTLARYIGVFTTPENAAAENASPEKMDMTAPVVLSPEKIDMTAPVVMSRGEPQKLDMTAPVVMGNEDTERTMTFLLPAKYKAVEDAPKPSNLAVELSAVPAGRCEAVWSYSGNLDMDQAPDRAKGLLEALQRDGVKVTGQYTVQGYNPPFTLPWCKRNEIHVPVEAASITEPRPPAEGE